ncbi:hypothetical protein Tco_0748805 [Tanacetum coccineum]|uniref:Uncharacterized protein n=1 Tax=Tanacetum coccineum TaxID=301880 RepID=A0ABQ4YWM5_9ASTR
MKGSNKVLDLNIQCSLEIVKDGQIDTIDTEPQNIIGLESPIKVDNMNTKSGYTNKYQKDKQRVAKTCSHTRKQSLVSELGGPQGDKEIINLNIEFGLQSVINSDPNTMVSVSQNDKRKRPAICSYVGNRHLVVDVGGHDILFLDFENSVIHSPTHEYGLRGCAVKDDSTSVGSAFVNDTAREVFYFGLENFVIRSPTSVENGRGLFIRSDLGREQIVMDFENSTVYMLSDKGVVTSIPRTPGFMAVFGSHSTIAPYIDSSVGCKCPLPSLGAIAATDIPSSMTTGHEKEQAWLSVSTGKCHCVSTAGRRTDEADASLDSTGPKRKKQKLHAVRVEQMRMPGALSSEGNNNPRNMTASNVRNKGNDGPQNLTASSVKNKGETSYNLAACAREHSNPCLSFDHALANQVESLKSFNTTKRKKTRVNSFRTKKMRKSGVSLIHQNAGPQNYEISTTQNEGVSSMYVDIGDCQWSCNHCRARFWYGERLKGYGNTQRPKYNKCCGGGMDIARIIRKEPKTGQKLTRDGKSTQEPGVKLESTKVNQNQPWSTHVKTKP